MEPDRSNKPEKLQCCAPRNHIHRRDDALPEIAHTLDAPMNRVFEDLFQITT
jgi:hypothetical protein